MTEEQKKSNAEWYREYYRQNRDSILARRAELKLNGSKNSPEHERRNRIIELLGGECVNCGYSDSRALQIDHVNGGGSRERYSFSCNSTYMTHVLMKVESGSADYQILCANCNSIKMREQKECAPGRVRK